MDNNDLLNMYCDNTVVLGNEVDGSDDKVMYLIDAELLKLILSKIDKY